MALIVTPGQLNQRSDFYFQLHSLTKAGVPIIQALEMLVANRSARSFTPHLEAMILRLRQGSTFYEALRSRPGWLPEFDLALLEAAEHSGRLEPVLKNLGEYYKDRAATTRSILWSLSYPFFIIHLFILVFPPRLLPLLVWQGEVGMFVTQKLSVFIPMYLLIAVGVFSMQSSRGRSTRLFMENVTSMLPFLGKARRDLALSRFSNALEALLGAGVSTINAWRLAANASGSNRIQKAVAVVLPRVQAGVTPGEAIQQVDAFPEVFKNLYATGELSGQLDDSLSRLRDYFHEQSTSRFQAFAQWMPRMVLLIIVLGIAYMVFQFWVGYYGNLFRQLE